MSPSEDRNRDLAIPPKSPRPRLDRGLWQKHVDREIGCSKASLLKWEKSRAEPELRFLPAVLAFLGYGLPTEARDLWRTHQGRPRGSGTLRGSARLATRARPRHGRRLGAGRSAAPLPAHPPGGEVGVALARKGRCRLTSGVRDGHRAARGDHHTIAGALRGAAGGAAEEESAREVPVPDAPAPAAEPERRRTAPATALPAPPSPPPARERRLSPVEPAPLGRGGPEHQYLQELVKWWAEAKGYRATVEEPLASGGKVDVALRRRAYPRLRDLRHEIGNMKKVPGGRLR